MYTYGSFAEVINTFAAKLIEYALLESFGKKRVIVGLDSFPAGLHKQTLPLYSQPGK